MSAIVESAAARQILRTYATLTLLSTFASSTIWGINTLFLLDAGLSVSEAFMANAFFTVGMVAFEVPTGVVADAVGRRASYLLSVATLFASTLLYLLMWQMSAPLVEAYAVAALSAALVAGAQILGGVLVAQVARVFRRRTSVLLAGSALTVALLVLFGLVGSFGPAIVLLALWATVFAMMGPVRQAFLNGLIPSAQRATVLSSDNLLASAGGVVAQPGLGKVADAWSYGASYLVGAGVQLLALPFIVAARRQRASSDPTDDDPTDVPELPDIGTLEPAQPA